MKDRGMKKWLAYKSLTSQTDFLNKMKEERSLEERPLISRSMAEEINEVLTDYCGQEIIVKVYLGGHIKEIQGKINKIDPIYKVIKINDITIPFKDIIKFD